MTRLLALLALAFAVVGCSDAPPPEVEPSAGTATVRSNESEDVVAPDRLDSDTPPDTTLSATVTVAGRTVPRRATVADVEAGEQACYLTLRTDAGATEEVTGDFSLCGGQAILGERVQIEYVPDVVPAASCGDDPECLDTETVPFAVAVDVIGRR